MKCVERRNLGEIKETCDGGIEEVRDTTVSNKTAFKDLCRFPSEENKIRYKRMTN